MNQLDVAAIRKDFPMLGREMNGHPLVYLDNAATSQKPRAMIERLRDFYTNENAKTEEGHGLSKKATEAFEGARAKVAEFTNADESEIVFQRGATEALNHLANVFARGVLREGDEILVTAMEHHSNIVPWQIACGESGARLVVAPINEAGELDMAAFESKLTARTKLVAVAHVSNVLGTVNPLKEIVSTAHARDVPVVVDGAQGIPHLPLDVRDTGCDFYAVSGHKMGGPSSVGFLYGRAEWLERLPIIEGGSHMAEEVSFEKEARFKPPPMKYEAGTPAFAEVIAYGAAVEYWSGLGMEAVAAYEGELLDYATKRLRAVERVRVVGAAREKSSILSFVVEGVEPKKIEEYLDRGGIAVRGGTMSAQPLIKLLGVEGVVRASFMFYNTREEADALAGAVARCIEEAG